MVWYTIHESGRSQCQNFENKSSYVSDTWLEIAHFIYRWGRAQMLLWIDSCLAPLLFYGLKRLSWLWNVTFNWSHKAVTLFRTQSTWSSTAQNAALLRGILCAVGGSHGKRVLRSASRSSKNACNLFEKEQQLWLSHSKVSDSRTKLMNSTKFSGVSQIVFKKMKPNTVQSEHILNGDRCVTRRSVVFRFCKQKYQRYKYQRFNYKKKL